jgi:hypothetical protein
MIRHSFRRSHGAPVLTSTLTSRGIVVERGQDRREVIPYAQIRGINLQSHGLQLGFPRYTCSISAANHRKLTLSNVDFVGLARVESRDDTYRQFVKTLHHLVELHRESIEFTCGSNGMFWLGWLLISSASVILLGSLFLLGTKEIVTAIIAIGLGPAFAYGTFCTCAYRRDTYSPETVPADMLPGEQPDDVRQKPDQRRVPD